jgi:multiple sugar transport system ATP-binding protein
MVFQSYALYPHMTVAENITFGLRTLRTDKAEMAQRLAKAASMLQLDDLLDRKPAQLSGGQRQRVAIGRAIVREPVAFLFDEPLSNLDAALRARMRFELQSLHRKLGTTTIYVTHDQVEAMTMADRIVVLNEGRIEQIGPPLDLYERPSNLFVAGFIGSPRMNFIETSIVGIGPDGVRVRLPDGGEMGLPMLGVDKEAGASVTLGIRPEHITLDRAGGATLRGAVEAIEYLGADTIVHVAIDSELLVVRAPGMVRLRPEDSVTLGLDTSSCHLFSSDGGTL